jgi:predicted RNase H-like HicB family nuclease
VVPNPPTILRFNHIPIFTLFLNYEIILKWSNEDNVFIAEVPELPGCMAHGNSYEKALATAKEAINLWTDTAKEFGDPVPVPKGKGRG